MRPEAPIFEKIYTDYLTQVAAADFTRKADMLGVRIDGDAIEIPLFHKRFTVSPEGVFDLRGKRPHHAVSVLLCQYLLLCPETPGADRELVTYKDFRHAAPYVDGFRNTVERPIARHFSGRPEALETCCENLRGVAADIGVASDLSFGFKALPEVPVFLLFNDRDDEFAAECTLLFERRAGTFLDMECLAMIGGLLSQWLISMDRNT